MSKVVGSVWFGTIGIVQIVQDHEVELYRQTGVCNFKYYIGQASGTDEKTDRQHIAEYGMPFGVSAGDVLFGVGRYLKDDWK